MSDYRRGFGLLIGFIEHLQIVTTNKYGGSLQHTLGIYSLLCLQQSLPGNGFQRWTFPLLWVPELSPCLSYQVLTATVHKDGTSTVP
jgi:hypothetical protein